MIRKSNLTRPSPSARAALAVLALAAPILLATGAESEIDAAREAFEGGRFEEAKTRLLDHVDAQPGDAEALYLLGLAERALGDASEAADRLEQAIAADGEQARYHSALGTALIDKAQTMDMFSAGPVYMSAMERYKRAVALDPDNVEAHIGLCRYYWNAPPIAGGSMKKAKEHAAEVERIVPRQGKIEFALIAQKEGRVDDAIAGLEEALSMGSADVPTRFELAGLYLAAGDREQAKAAYQRVLELDPDHRAAQAALEGLQR